MEFEVITERRSDWANFQFPVRCLADKVKHGTFRNMEKSTVGQMEYSSR